jgi:hypothetical protein
MIAQLIQSPLFEISVPNQYRLKLQARFLLRICSLQ